jgi:hypothetical protein
VLTVDCYAREGQGYSARWQAFLAYDSERDVLSAFSGDQPLVATTLQDSLVMLQGAGGTRYVNERMYVVRSTTDGSALLVLDPVAGTVAPLTPSSKCSSTLLFRHYNLQLIKKLTFTRWTSCKKKRQKAF